MPVWLFQQKNTLYFNVKDYGAMGDGSTDDTTAITATISAASTAGGGTVIFPAGTYITQAQTLSSNVYCVGNGIDATTIKLKNGANADLFSANTSSINLAAAYGSGSNIGVHSFGFADMTLDGNTANQSSGTSYLLRFYGYKCLLQNVFLQNGYSGGILCDWHPGVAQNGAESRLSNVSVYSCNGWGIEWGGPTDCIWESIVVALCSVGAIHIAPNGGGLQANNTHTWNTGTGNTIGWLVETDTCMLSNCEAEAEGKFMMVILGNDFTIRGRVFAGSLGSTAGGIQIGQQAGQTPYTGQILVSGGTTISKAPVGYIIDVAIDGLTASRGGIWFANDGGYAKVKAVCGLSGTVPAYTGTPYFGGSDISFIVSGTTPDGSEALSGGASFGISAYNAFTVYDQADHSIFNVNTYSSPPIVVLGVNTNFKMLDALGQNLFTIGGGVFSFGASFDTDLYRGGAGILKTDGTVAIGQSATSPDPGNGGTITTAGIGVARVTPTGNETGVILQAGTVAGQQCTVINNSSSFSITFAASGSHVAQGSSLTIAANTKYIFVWDSVAGLWY